MQCSYIKHLTLYSTTLLIHLKSTGRQEPTAGYIFQASQQFCEDMKHLNEIVPNYSITKKYNHLAMIVAVKKRTYTYILKNSEQKIKYFFHTTPI